MNKFAHSQSYHGIKRLRRFFHARVRAIDSLRGRDPRTDTGWGRGKGHSMSETTANAGTTPQVEGAANENPAMEGSQPKTFTQEEVDKLMGDLRKKERARYASYDEYKAAAAERAKLTEKDKTELLKATERAEAAEARLAEREAAEAIALAAREVSKATGVPEEALRGSTREEIEAHAEVLKPFFAKGAAPVVQTGSPSTETSATGDPLRDAISNAL